MQIRELSTDEWPGNLREIPAPPKKLWFSGALPPKGTKFLTVVGSRAMTRYAQEACTELITGLAGYSVSIVSGLALGVDTCAHKAALAAGLHTLAFPGSGLGEGVLYPKSNRAFAKEIVEKGGALISEYSPESASHIHHFPERNRLMVGVADAVLLVEAGPKSGTLITARLAGEYNRELLCVPHRIGDPHAFGSTLFLRLGATLVSEPLHLLEALQIAPREGAARDGTPPSDLSDAEQTVWEHLAEPLARDELIRASGLPHGEALTALIALELRGLAKESFGLWRRA